MARMSRWVEQGDQQREMIKNWSSYPKTMKAQYTRLKVDHSNANNSNVIADYDYRGTDR